MELSESSTMDLIDELRDRMAWMSPLDRGELFEEITDGYRYIPSILVENPPRSMGRVPDEDWPEEEVE